MFDILKSSSDKTNSNFFFTFMYNFDMLFLRSRVELSITKAGYSKTKYFNDEKVIFYNIET